MLQKIVRLLARKAAALDPEYPVLRPLDHQGVEILADADFQRSCREIEGLTLLDTPRLANLWMLCRMTNPSGAILEAGSFKGGGALHLSNCAPARKVIVCDSFEGFRELDPELDRNFNARQFKNTSQQAVAELFQSRGRSHQVIAGYFPQSCASLELGPISFVHLDVDTYQSTLESLQYLGGRLLEKSIMVLDDYFRRADGVNEAVRQFTQANPSWTAFPMFPGQAMLINRSWF